MDKKAALFFDIDGTLIDDRTNELSRERCGGGKTGQGSRASDLH